MNEDENVAVTALMGMKQSLVSCTKLEVQPKSGTLCDQDLFLSAAPNANCATKKSKRSNGKHAKNQPKRFDNTSMHPKLGLLCKSSSKAKSTIQRKKPKLISPVSAAGAKNGRTISSKSERASIASASLLPMLTERCMSTDLTLAENRLLPKPTSQTTPLIDTPREAVNGAEQASRHIEPSFLRQEIQDYQNRCQSLTQDVVAAILTGEIQKMNVLVNAQQQEMFATNHISNYIAAALSQQNTTLPGLALASIPSLSRASQAPFTSDEKRVPQSLSWQWTNFISNGFRNDSLPANNMSGITNALLLKLLQQSTAPSSLP